MSRAHRLSFVRHGEAAATWGQSADPPLSELGQRQAERVGEQLTVDLRDTTPTLISSPLLRAQQTAEPLARSLGHTVRTDARFREIPSTVPLDARQAWLTGFMRSRWSEQESALHTWRADILAAVTELPPGSVVFTHFLVINTIAGWVHDADETLLLWPANASVTTLTLVDGAWSLEPGEQMESRVN